MDGVPLGWASIIFDIPIPTSSIPLSQHLRSPAAPRPHWTSSATRSRTLSWSTDCMFLLSRTSSKWVIELLLLRRFLFLKLLLLIKKDKREGPTVSSLHVRPPCLRIKHLPVQVKRPMDGVPLGWASYIFDIPIPTSSIPPSQHLRSPAAAPRPHLTSSAARSRTLSWFIYRVLLLS